GCLPAAGLQIVISQAPPLPPNPQTIAVNLQPGTSQVVPWQYNLSAVPANLVFSVDPNNSLAECSENLGSTVGCGLSGSLQRQVTMPACAACSTSANAGPDQTMCSGRDATLDASASTFGCA